MRVFFGILLSLGLFATNLCAQSSLFINQGGYLPNSVKFVVTDGLADSFKVIDINTNSEMYAGGFTAYFNNDELTGMNLRIGDFSSFSQKGKFKIVSNSGETSFPFAIADTTFEKVYRYSQKAFYFQRCGMRLLQEFAGAYHHLTCHGADAFFHESTGLSGFKYAIGGWHDAGDFGKYVVNAGVSLGTLMMAYEFFPDYFLADNLGIPESGNQVPDLLDEIRYELEWLLNMQDASGGVFAKLTRKQFSGFIMPEEDAATRYIYEISSAATADLGAVTAKAARIFKDFDSEFSTRCKNAAESAWNYLVDKPDIIPAGGFVNPDDTETGEYGDTYDKDERLWMAAELFALTGESEYENYYLNNFNSVGLFGSFSWQWVAPLAHLAYLNSGNADELVSTILNESFDESVNSIKNKMDSNGFSIPLENGEFYWGSNGEVLNRAVLLISHDYLNDADENTDYVNRILNYILGVNPFNQSFVSGVGTKSLMHPHHRQSEADNIEEPVPGLLAGGPNQYLNDPTLQDLFDGNTRPALCYIDSVSSYASNEVAINWNAPLVFVAGYLNGKGNVSDVRNDDDSLQPNFMKLYQNYPNPFPKGLGGNPGTNIKFQIWQHSFVKLEIFDSLGKRISVLCDEQLNPGVYSYSFSVNTNKISSGIFFYKLTVDNYSVTKKMAYLK